MKDAKYIVALDQGTSSCRAMLFDTKGVQVGVEQQEFTQIFPQAGWVEHDPNEIWEVQMQVLERLIVKSGIDVAQVKGIGITNQRETTIVWDKHTGEPIYNAIVWQDKRTIDYCKALKDEGLDAYTKDNMGLPIDPYFSGTKVKWILENNPHNTVLFGTIDTWLIWKMTEGRSHVTDFTNASRTLLYNIKTKDWDDHILEKFGIPRSILPTVQDSASHFGDFLYQGLNIPITGVAGDQQAALCGQACFEKGMAKNTYGTGCFMLMHVGSEFVKSNHGLLTTLCCDKDGKAAYALEGSIFMAGASVQWLRDGLGIIASSGETEQLAKRVEGDTSVVVVPAFAGLGAPYWSMESKGALFGLTRDTTKAHLVKATLESMAFRTKDVLEAMEKDSSTALKILRVDGGACRNNYLMQFQADILDVEVERPQNVETTAIGVAYLAGITLDFWDTAAFDSYRKVDQAFSPSMAVGMREKLYKRWLNAVESTIAFGA